MRLSQINIWNQKIETGKRVFIRAALVTSILLVSPIVDTKAEPEQFLRINQQLAHLEARDRQLVELLRNGASTAPSAQDSKHLGVLFGNEDSALKLASMSSDHFEQEITPAIPEPQKEPAPVISREDLEREVDSLKQLEQRFDALSKQIELAQKETNKFQGTQTTLARSIDTLVEQEANERAEMKLFQAENRGPAPKNYALPTQPGYQLASESGSTGSIAFITAKSISLRSVPNVRGARLFMVGAEEKVVVERRSQEWFRVVHTSGIRGWVPGEALSFPSRHPNDLVALDAAEG